MKNELHCLLLQQDYLTLEAIKPWSYWCNIGIADALTAVGIQVDIAFIPHFAVLKEAIPWERYDVVILNDIAHGLDLTHRSIRLTPDDMEYIARRKKKLVGIAAESLFGYTNSEGKLHDFAKNRLLNFIRSIDYFDAFLLADIRDIDDLRRLSAAPSTWMWPWAHPGISLHLPEADKPRPYRLGFNGSMYEGRIQYIRAERLAELQLFSIPNEDADYWTPILGYLHPESLQTLAIRDFADYQRRMAIPVRNLRFAAEDNLVSCLSSFEATVHLPAYFKGPHSRAIQSIQGGAICFCPALPGEESRFFRDRIDCIYYHPDQVGDLRNKIDQVFRDEDFKRELLMNATHFNQNGRSMYSAGLVYKGLLRQISV